MDIYVEVYKKDCDGYRLFDCRPIHLVSYVSSGKLKKYAIQRISAVHGETGWYAVFDNGHKIIDFKYTKK